MTARRRGLPALFFRVRLRNPVDGSSWEKIVRGECSAEAMLYEVGRERRRGRRTQAVSSRPFEGRSAGR